ncbi:OsmC family protein [Cupriavidus sp. MP-37]|uniref:OsmC family protein n=1 Tax=Cupriavidus sp. MP-37 TaxID=2884455 RepID=UPI001D0BA670|nr:hypothetical protein [Cupriavidus sp. MP-37]UDM52702.1 hypothetical protein LIN44_26175 [Cupriavidus sp. MP-37]
MTRAGFISHQNGMPSPNAMASSPLIALRRSRAMAGSIGMPAQRAPQKPIFQGVFAFSISPTKRSLTGALRTEQQKRLLQIADACPVHKLLTGEVRIDTHLAT